jgi:hypothetical protein
MSIVTLTDFKSAVPFTSKNGSNYIKAELYYINSKGEAKVRNILNSDPLYQKLAALGLKGGITVDMKSVKDGQWFKLVDVAVVDPTSIPNSGTQTKKEFKSSYDSLGQQIGNCITNSIASLGAGKTISEYENRAKDLILMGQRLRSQAEANKLSTSTPKQDTVNNHDALLEDDLNTRAAHSHDEEELDNEDPF